MQDLTDHLLHGAAEIAAFLNTSTRRVYHLVDKGTIPVFHLGGLLCCRRSTVVRYIEELEAGEIT